MKIMLLDKQRGVPGTYGGAIQLGMLVSDILLNDLDIAKTTGFGHSGEKNSEYIISLRDEVFVGHLPRSESGFRQSYYKMFTLGEAKATVAEGPNRTLQISIESPTTSDFFSLRKIVYEDWLGIPHEVIPVPTYRMQELSFIRGIRNDLRDLCRFLKSHLHGVHALITGQTT